MHALETSGRATGWYFRKRLQNADVAWIHLEKWVGSEYVEESGVNGIWGQDTWKEGEAKEIMEETRRGQEKESLQLTDH